MPIDPPDLTPAPKHKWRRGMGNRNAVPTSADVVAEELRRDRRIRAMKLRVHGISKRRIATILGVCEKTVTRDIQEAIAEREAEDKAELQSLATQALEAVLEGHLKRARAGDKDSAMVVIKAVAEHAKINGYAEPEKRDVSLNVGKTPADAHRVMQELFGGNVGPVATDGAEDGTSDALGPAQGPTTH